MVSHRPEVPSAARPTGPTGPTGSALAPPDPGPAPGPVRRAVALVWVLLVVDGIGAAATLLSLPGDVRDDAIASRPDLDPAAVGVSAALVVGAAVGLLLVVALHAVVAVRLRAGRTWPRTVLVVLAGLGVLGALVPTDGPVGLAALAWNVGSLALLVAAIVLLLHPASRA